MAKAKTNPINNMTIPKNTETLSFEESMQELEAIVNKMEQGELPLESALQSFERGIQLARQSQQKLKQAEQKVQILMSQNGQENLIPFEDKVQSD